LVGWNDTSREYPQTLLHELVQAQAERTPEAVALVFEETQLSYAELNERANRLAHYLRARGVGPEARVGILMHRSVELVVSLLAVLKAGAAYVPLDPEYPQERLEFMLEDSQAQVLLTQQRLLAEMSWCAGAVAETIAVDELRFDEVSEFSAPPDLGPLSPDNLAYIIYTSGSTGRPKGAMNTHRGIVNRLLWMQDTYQLQANDCVLQKTPFSFDVSVWEFFWPLLSGARTGAGATRRTS
jgi:non-ribosomal peptide synthetase component F